jgi:hypothetical protein
MTLVTDYNLGHDGDDLFAALLQAHQGLSAEASAALNARLVLILMNHIGNHQVLDQAVRLARDPSHAPD